MRAALTERAVELERSRVPFVHATVVRVERPTSARAGDSALIHANGDIEGFVGGSCAESSVRLFALEALASGEPVLLRVRPGEPGTMYGEGAVTVANPCLSGGTLEIFLEPRRPAPRLLVVGDTPVAQALLELGGPLGFEVTLVAGEDAEPNGEEAALIVASHGRGEEPALERALRAGTPYVALVASRVRGAAVVASLDTDDDLRGLVHCPAGLEIGARSAPEIALAILAELVATRAPGLEASGANVAPATALDPICGMPVAITPGTIQLEQQGGSVYFCGDHCRAAFVANLAGSPTAP
ncbi:MAG: XdhC family protein [Candidatus Dormiibacterota bacterium]